MHALHLLYLVACFASAKTAGQGFNINVTHSVPCDRKTRSGDVLSVNYNGTLLNGTLFDSSYTDNGSDPFSFTLGAGEVIKGWDLGLLDMCISDQRTLTLPPDYAYGNRAVGPIPANSTLLFQTELEGIQGVTRLVHH